MSAQPEHPWIAAENKKIAERRRTFEEAVYRKLPKRGSPCQYSVRPRYTAGSGASVDIHTAYRVACQEIDAHAHALSGTEGELNQLRAELLGLRGIAMLMVETGSGRNFRWLIADMCTDEVYRRHGDGELERLGYTRFSTLHRRAQETINLTGRTSDYDHRWYRCDPKTLDWIEYQVEIVKDP